MTAQGRPALRASARTEVEAAALSCWCGQPATVRVVWQHPGTDCWCVEIPGNDRRHLARVCGRHVGAELEDLEHLGYVVVAVGPPQPDVQPWSAGLR